MSSRMGLSSAFAAARASGPNSRQRTGWCIAERRYADDACASAFNSLVSVVIATSLRFRNQLHRIDSHGTSGRDIHREHLLGRRLLQPSLSARGGLLEGPTWKNG